MKQMSSNKKSSSSNKTVKYKIDTKSNVLLESNIEANGFKSNAKIIVDKDAPFFQHRIK